MKKEDNVIPFVSTHNPYNVNMNETINSCKTILKISEKMKNVLNKITACGTNACLSEAIILLKMFS